MTQSAPQTSTFPSLGAGIASTTSTPSTSSFNAGATEFVPKKKIVKTEEQFPSLDMAATKEPAKKKVATQE